MHRGEKSQPGEYDMILMDIQKSFSAGMNAHVSKPVEMKVLGKAIQNIKAGRGGVDFSLKTAIINDD